jgi:hypothetical protein
LIIDEDQTQLRRVGEGLRVGSSQEREARAAPKGSAAKMIADS